MFQRVHGWLKPTAPGGRRPRGMPPAGPAGPPPPNTRVRIERAEPSEREKRLERALHLARGVIARERGMNTDALTVIDNALEAP